MNIDDFLYAPIEGIPVVLEHRMVPVGDVVYECRLERLDGFHRWWVYPQPSEEHALALAERLDSVA